MAVVVLNLHRLPAAPATLWQIGPSVSLTITATLALSYNRSRIFFTCCLLGFGLWLTQVQSPAGLTDLVLMGLVTLNIFVICLYSERGILTATGLLRLLVIGLQIFAVVFVVDQSLTLGEALLNPLPAPFSIPLDYLPWDQLVSALFIPAGVACLIAVGVDDTPITQGIVTAQSCLILGYTLAADHAFDTFFIAGSLYLGASIIRDSWNMAYRDELTGLPHRRALNELFLTLGNRYAVAMLDVDHFKKFNDTHGHDVGDQVLQMVAARIGRVGGGGKAYRYGGEEFTVVFPGAKKEDAMYPLDELRKAIQNYEMVIRADERFDATADKASKKKRAKGSFRTADKKVSVTVSIGVSDHQSVPGKPEDVLKAADEALYKAKKAGRNQVSMG